jgi:hypothetical protein
MTQENERYLVVTADGIVNNIVMWDGNPDWSPPAGCIALLADEHPELDPFAGVDPYAAPEESE